jgi:hypothetical protein
MASASLMLLSTSAGEIRPEVSLKDNAMKVKLVFKNKQVDYFNQAKNEDRSQFPFDDRSD